MTKQQAAAPAPSNDASPSTRPDDNIHVSSKAVQAIAATAGPSTPLRAAREGASYKGSLIYADSQVLIQLTGGEQRIAVVHQRHAVHLQGSSLADRDARNDLVGRNIQIHYRSGSGKAYPWDAEKERRARLLAEPNRLLAAARLYAADHIGNPRSREVFLGHFSQILSGLTNTVPNQERQPNPTRSREIDGASTDRPRGISR